MDTEKIDYAIYKLYIMFISEMEFDISKNNRIKFLAYLTEKISKYT